MAFLFGPVPSRRLGRSLGVDLIPRKTCPFDCIYCEVGPTTARTAGRRNFETEAIIRELEGYLAGPHPALDFITLAGSGEPTLNLGLGRIIEAAKSLTATPLAVLTNGALLHLPAVRRELAAADVVLPSLDAGSEETFQAINRPLQGFTLTRLRQGLRAFRREYRGQIWLEIMLVPGLNDGEAELAALRDCIREIAPDKVQLNTPVRPGVEDWVKPLSSEEMAAIAAFLGGPVEVIAAFDRGPAAGLSPSDGQFLEALARRPMTAVDLAKVLGLPVFLVREKLTRFGGEGLVSSDRYQNEEFYRCNLP